MSDRGTYRWKRSRRTHCLRGHPLSGDNLFTRQRPNYEEHRCKACHSIYSKARYARARADRESK